MIPELGHFALILAATVALLQGTLPFVGAKRGDAGLMSIAPVAACVQAIPGIVVHQQRLLGRVRGVELE
jgi:cytochrome c-type biogenesis protein CcmF